MPARYLFLDEVDAYPPSADEEGDPVALAEAGRDLAWRRKVFGLDADDQGQSRIERVRGLTSGATVACLHCGQRQHSVVRAAAVEQGPPETAAYRCEACEERIEERHKTACSPGRGQQYPPRPTADRGLPHLQPLRPLWLSWERIAREWLAQGSGRGVRSFRTGSWAT